MRKYIAFLIIFLNTFLISAQNVFTTRIFKQDIKTLQAGIKRQKFLLPIIELGSSDLLEFSFDQMSHESRTYRYKVIHLNADRTPSDLMSSEYLSGFTNADISDYALSINATYLYTHYKFNLPNENISFKISGNYAVVIYQDNKPEDPVAIACFSIVEPKVGISAVVRGNTDTELNGRYQQIDFDVALKGYRVRDANAEIKVIVRQNNRTDNEVINLKPTYLSGDKLSFVNNRQLIFEGGNEYHRFDISSVYSASEGIEDIKYVQPHYEVLLTPNKVQTSKTYMHNFDVNGKFLINYQEAFDNVHTEADYMLVHFRLPVKQVFFDGQIFLGGELNYNLLNDASRMQYDAKNEMYYKSILLKQGGYNYQFWFVPKGEKKASVERVDGSYWQTRNEYTIYVYHRAWGERYDRLVGVKQLE